MESCRHGSENDRSSSEYLGIVLDSLNSFSDSRNSSVLRHQAYHLSITFTTEVRQGITPGLLDIVIIGMRLHRLQNSKADAFSDSKLEDYIMRLS